jgi:hypothetical protein
MAYRYTYTHIIDTLSGAWMHLMQSTREALNLESIARIWYRQKAAQKGRRVKLPRSESYALRCFS